MKQELDAHAIKFRLVPNIGPHTETIFMSMEAFEKLPVKDEWGNHNIESIIPEYFTKSKIEEYKKKMCEHIMNSEISICVVDLDCYLVDSDKIWK